MLHVFESHLYLFVSISFLIMISVFLWRYFYQSISPSREVAITIDDVPTDLPILEKILDHLSTFKVPVTVFVIANRLNHETFNLLNNLKNDRFVIGNHSFSHKNLEVTPTQHYIRDLQYADEILAPLLSKHRYFRYPYLSTGKWFKKRRVRQYLEDNNYIIAPVTIRSRDAGLNKELMSHPHTESFLESMKQRYLQLVWKKTLRSERKLRSKKQILLIHANPLNGYFLGDLLKMYVDKGYRFITLEEAMS